MSNKDSRTITTQPVHTQHITVNSSSQIIKVVQGRSPIFFNPNPTIIKIIQVTQKIYVKPM